MIKIDLYGDSTQVGNEPLVGGGYAITARPPSVILQEMFDDYYPNQVLVRNKGIGSTRMTEFWEGTGQYTRTFAQEMALSDAHIVVTNHGINDAYQNWPANMYVQYVNAMAQSSTSYGKKFFIETPNPMTTSAAAVGDSYAKALYTTPVSAQAGIIDVFRLVKNNMDYWTIDGLRDGFHPSEELYGYIGRVLFAALETPVKYLIANPPSTPQYEDLTTYNETDPNSNLTVTASSVNFTLTRAVSACLSKPLTVNNIKINFEYTMTTSPTGGVNPHAWMMVLANAENSQAVLPNQGAGYAQGILIGRGSSPMIQLYENNNGTVYSTAIQPLTLGYKYFATYEKTATHLTLKLYTNEQRTNLTASLSLPLHSNQTFQYLNVIQSLNSGHTTAFSGVIGNINVI